jgi:glycosyltransferase involved in cell wall biosynthesis
VAIFRAVRQAQYAVRRGWLRKESHWWRMAAGQFKANLKKRKPLTWASYFGWMRLMRRPAKNEVQWQRTQSAMGVAKRSAHELDLPRISISATNPCHLYSLARVLARSGALDHYYSGYPRWKLAGSEGSWVKSHSSRTLAVYGALKLLPPECRPKPETMFRWQDSAFDHWVSRQLTSPDFIHAMPGQCLHTFRRARELGIHTVLNHATGPIENTIRVLKAEYERAHLEMPELDSSNERSLKNRREEMALADFHCVASTLVRDQLISTCGIKAEKIWVIPYGADQDIFYPRRGKGPEDFRIVYAGQYALRKGLRFLLGALEQVGGKNWSLDCYGPKFGGQTEMIPDLEQYKCPCPVRFHGALPAAKLAQVFRESSLLVLPSLEEGFGLVVVQALNCGIPCLVSDSVGARDLIVPGENGSVFPTGDAGVLGEQLVRWSSQRRSLHKLYPWEHQARKLIETSRSVWNE